jgi:hypothetical protein
MTAPEHSNPDLLLAYALFDLDPRVQDLRPPLLTFLVSVTLFELERPASPEELVVACQEQFLSEDRLHLEEIEKVVAIAVQNQLLIAVEGGRVDLPQQRREDLAGAAERITARRAIFHRSIAKAVKAELGEPLSPELAKGLEAALDRFIQGLLHAKSVALARAFGPGGAGFDENTKEHVNEVGLRQFVLDILPNGEQLRRAQIASGIREGLMTLDPDGLGHLAAVYQKTVAFALLQQDPLVRTIKRDLAQQRIWYLDTNVAMALMFSAHAQHEAARAAVDAARALGCELLVSPFTIEELRIQLKEADEVYNEKGLKDLQGVLSEVNNDILRTFALKSEDNPGLRWTPFYATYDPPEGYLASKGIDVADASAAAAQRDGRWLEVREAVRKAKPNSHPKVIDCDTNNLLLIQRRRKKYPSDEMGSRVWLITLDMALMPAERQLVGKGVYEVQSSKRLIEWTADLSPHLSPDDLDLGEYALHLVQSQLGTFVEDPIFADVNFLTTLVESRFDLEDLVSGNSEMTRQVLVALQREWEIQELLEGRPAEGEKHEAWAKELAEIVAQALAKLDQTSESERERDRVKRELDRARGKVSSMRQERDWSRRQVSELERRLKNIHEHPPVPPTVRARLRDWFSRVLRGNGEID